MPGAGDALLRALGPGWSIRPAGGWPQWQLDKDGLPCCFAESEDSIPAAFAANVRRMEGVVFRLFDVPDWLLARSEEELLLKLAVNGFLENPESRHVDSRAKR